MVKSNDYKHFQWHNKTIELDPEGFLLNLEDWNREIADLLAKQDDLILTESHWEIIEFCQGYYKEYGLIPIMRILSRAIARQLGADKAGSRYLYQLFPLGPVRQASRIGGLPKPPSCI